MITPLLLGSVLAAPPVVLGPPLNDETPTHVALALRLSDQEALDRLLASLQDPQSPDYHRFVTPEQFGARFGLPPTEYDSLAAWLGGGGFEVTRYPNRLFLEGIGTAGGVRRLFGVRLRSASAGGRTFRTYEGTATLPPDLASLVLRIVGLDTRVHLRHRILTSYGDALGADDLRLEYDMTSLVAGGQAAAGLTTVVLGTQEGTTANANAQTATAPFIPPSVTAIQAYFSQISGATATYNPIVMTNSNDDFDLAGSNSEYQLDVEMQSVGAPNAQEIDLVLSPASEVFMTGAQYIVNNLPSAAVVSTSLGLCEAEEAQYNGGGPNTSGSEPAVMRQAVQQGVAEGQAWFAAAGDMGADDCNDDTSGTGNGFGSGNATVDFPGSMPEIVDMGGTMFSADPSTWWSSGDALAAFQPETTCNEGDAGVAGGGGQSTFYAKPSWQTGIGPEVGDNARDVPDLSLEAASFTPGVAVYDCGSGQDETCQGETTGAGALDVFGGTSIASPLGAGIFALLAGEKGCPLGDVHMALYALGTAQKGGGVAPFHDIATGDNGYEDPAGLFIVGYQAGPGYDLATGWGSLDVAKLVSSWPACSGSSTTSSSSGGTSSSSIGGASSTGGSRSNSTGGSGAGSSGGRAGSSSGGRISSGGSAGSSSGSGTGSSSRGGVGVGGTPTPTPAAGGGCSCGTTPDGAVAFGFLLSLWALRRQRRC